MCQNNQDWWAVAVFWMVIGEVWMESEKDDLSWLPQHQMSFEQPNCTTLPQPVPATYYRSQLTCSCSPNKASVIHPSEI